MTIYYIHSTVALKDNGKGKSSQQTESQEAHVVCHIT
jgi:hypothetical protein